jgi:transcriptional regulator with XRE-family HTH domain
VSDRNGNSLAGPRGPVLLLREGRGAAAGTRALRKAAGLGPRALAARLDCTVAWLLGRERESVRLTRAECDRIAAALGTDFAGLLEAGARAIAERQAAS